MQRSIEITAPAATVDLLVRDLQRVEDVIGVVRLRGASVQPPECDVVIVHALNRGTDAVMRAVSRVVAQRGGPYSVATSELASLSDPDRQHAM